jgi:tetratricopeptide (TPR) repeat protein
VDNATKQQLKKPDQFISMTEHGIEWANQNRRTAVTAALVVLVVILAAVGAASWYTSRSNAAATAFGSAMQTYQTPVASAAQPVPPGMKSFPTAAARAAQANTEFQQVAKQYGLTPDGKLAKYFVGITYMEEGQNGPAEDALKPVAQIYAQTNRVPQAIDLYNELAKGKADTVPAGLAQLQLAELYESQGKTEQARQIYAEIKDKDKNSKGKPGAAAEIATEKLNPKAAAAPPAAE